MNQEDWQKLDKAFEHATNLSEKERNEYLADLKVNNVKLHQALSKLLISDNQPSLQIHQSISKEANSLLKNENRWLGRKFGAFSAVKEIASGGMGTVFLGERVDSDFKQQVAIKVLQTVLANKATIRYFENERKILASLSHPNIARLYDGGTTKEGLPYLVMEYIAGRPINNYCDENKLSIKRRISLFIQVCSAVEHAHRNLVVHRDIKPSNILVTNSGIPKLLDFGIAKEIVSDPNLTDNTILGKQILTPAYASPEQVKGESITTSSDVYSLGVLLYQLLTGRMPYEMNQKSAVSMISSICETQPNAPSLSVKIGGNELKGDLDSIILFALNKEPERRYLSVHQFSSDLKFWLEGKPVVARGNSTIYKLSKFIKKNAISVSTAFLLFASSLLFSFYSYQQALVIEREKNISEQVTDFIARIFSETNPSNKSKNPTAKELLIDALDRLDDEFDHIPEVKLRLQLIIGWSLQNMGEYEALDALFEDAIPQTEKSNTPAEIREEFQHLLGVARKKQGKYLESLKAYEKGLSIASTELKGTEIHATALSGLANINIDLGKYDNAIKLFDESLRIIDLLLDDDALAFHADAINELPIERSKTLHNYAIALYELARFSEALEVEKRVLEIQENQPEKETPRLANAYNFIGTLEWEVNNDLEKALHFYSKSLQINEEVLGIEHVNVAHNLTDIALLRVELNETNLAFEAFNRARNIFDKRLGAESYQVGRMSMFLAREKTKLGEFASANNLLNTAEAIFKKTIPEEHKSMRIFLQTKARYFESNNNLQASQDLLLRADEIISKLYPQANIYSIDNKLWLAKNYWSLKNKTLAREYLEQAKTHNQQSKSPELRKQEILQLSNLLLPD